MIWWTFTDSAISCKELPLTQRSKSQSTPTPPKRAPQVSEEVAPEPESLENLLAQMEEMDVCRRAFLGLVEIKKTDGGFDGTGFSSFHILCLVCFQQLLLKSLARQREAHWCVHFIELQYFAFEFTPKRTPWTCTSRRC